MERNQVYHADPEIMSGTPVFTGTRVPVHTLIDHLASGISLDEFLADFPTVSREQAVASLLSRKKRSSERRPQVPELESNHRNSPAYPSTHDT